MPLDPKALEKAAVAVVSNLVPDPMLDDVERIARAAITAYLAATKATAHDPAPVSGWRERIGEHIYRAMYEHEGGKWAANESKSVWFAIADRFIALEKLAAAPEPPVSREHHHKRQKALGSQGKNSLGEHHLKSTEIAAEIFDKWFYQGSKYPHQPGTIEQRFIDLVSPYLTRGVTSCAAPEPPVSDKWRDIVTSPSAKPVLVAYKNRCGKWRVVKAVRYEQYQNEQPADDDEGEVGEYCEEKDAYFVRAGWYELIDNWDDFGFVAIYEGDPVAWMNLPDHPKQQEPK